MLKYEIIDNQKEDWVVFIHGIGGSTKTWGKQIDAFSKKYNLLLLDLPGHGNNSEKVIRKVSPRKLYRGIRQTLDALGIEKCGHICSIENWRVFNQLALNHMAACQE